MLTLDKSFLLIPLTLTVGLAGGCAQMRAHARAINDAAQDKRAADAAFDAHQAETQANADAGWTEGVRLSEESEKAFETHLMMGDMFHKVTDELIAFEPNLTVEENKMLNTMCTMYAIDDAQGHYDAWDQAYAEFRSDLEDELQDRIAYGKAQRDALDPVFERNRAIVQDTVQVGRDAAAE